MDESVDPDRLSALLESADRVVVRANTSSGAKTLFASTDKKDLVALRRALVVRKPERTFACGCEGEPALYVYRGSDLLFELTNHHGQSVRCSLWRSDALLANPDRWVAWFDARKIRGPREEVEETRKQDQQGQKAWERWRSAMPAPVAPLWSRALGQFGIPGDVSPLTQAMAQGMPDRTQRVLALLEWYGSGEGPWSGCPAYEEVAEKMLLAYETKEIVSATETQPLTPRQTEGAARLLAGWSFSRERPNGLAEVPSALKQRLWDHVKKSRDADKRSRAAQAFRRSTKDIH